MHMHHKQYKHSMETSLCTASDKICVKHGTMAPERAIGNVISLPVGLR